MTSESLSLQEQLAFLNKFKDQGLGVLLLILWTLIPKMMVTIHRLCHYLKRRSSVSLESWDAISSHESRAPFKNSSSRVLSSIVFVRDPASLDIFYMSDQVCNLDIS